MKARHLLLVLAALTLALGVVPAQAQDKTICFGYTLPLTGEHAQYGEVFRNSATMALEAFNKAGKLPGVKVEIKFEDSKSDPKEAKAIARKFIDDKSILGVIGDFTTTVSMAAGQDYAAGNLTQLSQTASHPDYVKMSKWQFRNITTQIIEGPFVADWTMAKGFKSYAIIAVQNDWGVSAATEFKKAVEAKGGKVLALEYFNPGARDYRAILTKISRQNPDVIYACMMYEEGAMLMQQRQQLGLKTTVFGTSSLYSPKLLELAGEAANGLFLSTTFMPTSPEPHVKAYVEQYKARYKAEPNMFAAQAFDATNIMLEALVRAGKDATRESFRDALAQTKDFPGVTGKTTFDPQTREPQKVLSKMEIKNVKFELVK